MKHFILSAALLICGGAFAQSTSDSLALQMPGPTSYPDPSQMIHIERQDGFIVFSIANDVPTNIEQGNHWSLGPHVPYPIHELDFFIPETMCHDLLSCDSGSRLVDVAEVHLTGQHAGRQAGIRFSIQRQEESVDKVDVWMTDPEGNVLAVHTSMLEEK